MLTSRLLLLTLLSMPAPALLAQVTPAPGGLVAPALPSAILQPAIGMMQQTLPPLRVDKWKVPNPARDAALANLESIRRDLDVTLPPLLAKADAAPSSTRDLLLATRNVDALYDVLLRVTDTADIGAPGPEKAAVDQTLSSLLVARRALGDRLQTAINAQDDRIVDLRKQLAAQAAAATAVTPPVATPAPATSKKKPVPAAKTARKPVPAAIQSGTPK